jgi:hypothetical protein
MQCEQHEKAAPEHEETNTRKEIWQSMQSTRKLEKPIGVGAVSKKVGEGRENAALLMQVQ